MFVSRVSRYVEKFRFLTLTFLGEIFLAFSREPNGKSPNSDRMADGGAHSRYVKLTKDQGPLEDIKPGELNQPIEVPQVFLSKGLFQDPCIVNLCVLVL